MIAHQDLMLSPASLPQYGSRALTQTLTRKQIHVPAALPSFSPQIRLAGLNPYPLSHNQPHTPATPPSFSPAGRWLAGHDLCYTTEPIHLVLRPLSLPQSGSPASTQPRPHTTSVVAGAVSMTPGPPPAPRSRSWTAPSPTSSLLRILIHPNNSDVNTASPLTPAAR